jgi:CubicO group peptidase (beta-lactamase class C family)
MPSNIYGSMLRDRHNPYASYTIDSLLDWLSKYGRKIKLPLKEEVHYSNMGMALGWNVGQLYSARVRLYWHHGATGGYRAFIGFAKESETAVVILANSGLSGLDALLSTTSTDTVGFKVMELLNSPDN